MLRAMTAAQASEGPPGVAPRRGRRRWLPWTAAGAVVLAVLGYGSWWLLRSPLEGGVGFGIALSDVQPGETRSVGVAQLCLDGADRVTIDSVTVDPAGLTVTDFAVRLRPQPPALAFGGGGGPLRQIASGWSRTITAQCGTGDVAEVAIDLVRGVDGPAHTDHVDIRWSAGIRSGVLSLPVQATLCAPGQVDENCEEPPPPWQPIPG
jgi:hypothetical protein